MIPYYVMALPLIYKQEYNPRLRAIYGKITAQVTRLLQLLQAPSGASCRTHAVQPGIALLFPLNKSLISPLELTAVFVLA